MTLQKFSWDNYFKETEATKRWEILQSMDRLSYDHADNWIQTAIEHERKVKSEQVSRALERITGWTQLINMQDAPTHLRVSDIRELRQIIKEEFE